jgi:hypothetical protein
MKFAKLAFLATALAATPIAAHAADVVAGATVYGPQGGEVGTIESVGNGQAVLDTGKHKVPLGVESFGEGETGLTITVTKAQINQMMDEQVAAANAKRDAALVAGTAVNGASGNAAGVLKEVDLEADAIILENEAGPVALKKEHFAVDANGQLMVLFTAEQLAEAVAAANAAAQ